jgi:nucleoside-diphosphate kinase
MANMEKTLSIIKPDAVNRHLIGEIISRFEKAGLRVDAMRLHHLSKEEAGEFYAVHKERPFYGELVEYMSSAPVVLIALEGPDAVRKNREIMGATNPEDASCGTIRHDLALSIGENSVHGSDSLENAATEIAFFFG